MPDNVNHPDHYGGAGNPYEAIKVIEAHNLGFHLGLGKERAYRNASSMSGRRPLGR